MQHTIRTGISPPAGGKLDPLEAEAIVRGEHGDPFAVLGPHALSQGGRSAVAIRTFLPGATEVSIAMSRLMTMKDAIARFVRDGDLVVMEDAQRLLALQHPGARENIITRHKLAANPLGSTLKPYVSYVVVCARVGAAADPYCGIGSLCRAPAPAELTMDRISQTSGKA